MPRANSSEENEGKLTSARTAPLQLHKLLERGRQLFVAEDRLEAPDDAPAPDPIRTFAAMRRLDFAVHIATKPNRTHLLVGKQSLLLPCLGRTEIDIQAGGRQAVTVEDSMSMVHASKGLNPPASDQLKSEPAIVAGIARAVLGENDAIDWPGLVADYDRIRDLIARVFPDAFDNYNERVRTPGGFRLPVPPSDRVWKTDSGKANFMAHAPKAGDPRQGDASVMILTTLRSHDQYNTTIYGQNDRYRGVFGRRDVVFANPDDIAARSGLSVAQTQSELARLEVEGAVLMPEGFQPSGHAVLEPDILDKTFDRADGLRHRADPFQPEDGILLQG